MINILWVSFFAYFLYCSKFVESAICISIGASHGSWYRSIAFSIMSIESFFFVSLSKTFVGIAIRISISL
jgi:hypothetical protein